MFTYKNPFCQDKNSPTRTFTQEKKPVNYKDYMIFEHTRLEFHIVKDGYVVGMMTSLEGCKNRIDGKLPFGLYDVKNNTHTFNED